MAPDPLMERARRLVLQFPFGNGGFNGVKVLDEVSYQSPTTPSRIGILLAAEPDGDADVLFRDTGEIETVKWNSLFPVIGRLRRLPEQDVKVKEEPSTREEIIAKIAELKAENATATSWGAAVGARHEWIGELERQLRRIEATPVATPMADPDRDGLVKGLRELSAWLTEHDQDMRMPRGMIDPDKAADRISADGKRLATLLAVIRPLAEEARHWTAAAPSEFVLRLDIGTKGPKASRITVGDLRRALAALSKTKGGTTDG